MRLLLGDDHQMFLDLLGAGLRTRGHDVVAATARLDEIAGLVELHDPDLCLLDVDFGGRSVLPEVAAIRGRRPDLPIVLLSGSASGELRRAHDERLVQGAVDKLCDIVVLDRVIRRVLAGDRVVQRLDRPTPPIRTATRADLLSGQERAIVALLVQGASTQQMADALGISPHTVRSHVRSVLQKLGVNSRAKAARLGAALAAELPAPGRGR